MTSPSRPSMEGRAFEIERSPMIKGVIFDLDGVLVDAVDWHYRALNKALTLFGFGLSPEEHAKSYNGLPTCIKLDMLSKSKGLPSNLHSFISEMKQQYTLDTLQSQCVPSPSLSLLLQSLKAKGFQLAVASNSLRQTVDIVLEEMGISPFFDVVLSREEVKRSKPHPDIFFRALEMLDLKSSEVLIIEDSKPGIEAARQTTANVLPLNSPAELTLELIEKKIESLENSPQLFERKKWRTTPLIQVVIPMAGLGSRFQAAGYVHPKPFIEILGKPMIQWVKENVSPNNYKTAFSFLCNSDHLKNPLYRRTMENIAPASSLIPILNTTEGAACTVLLAIDKLNPAQPLLLANSDQWIDSPIDDFLKDAIDSDCDGSLLTFPATDLKWSYAKLSKSNQVAEVAEKKVISSHATVGIYYFKKAQDFIDAAFSMIRKDTRTNGEFYVCPVYNELIKRKKRIKIFEIDAAQMHGLGTPEDLKSFLSWHKSATLVPCTENIESSALPPASTKKPKSPTL